MRLFKKFKRLLRTIDEFGLSKLDVEIKRVKAAIRRQESMRSEMLDAIGPGDCCEMCAYGKSWMDVERKLERQRKRLKELIEKRG